jgi:hypothetical protein
MDDKGSGEGEGRSLGPQPRSHKMSFLKLLHPFHIQRHKCENTVWSPFDYLFFSLKAKQGSPYNGYYLNKVKQNETENNQRW